MPKTAKDTSTPLEKVGAAAAGDVVVRYVSEQVRAIEALEGPVRADAPDAVHQMRVALRRLRSVLASYRPVFDRAVTDPLRLDLAWLAGELGTARDLEVLRETVGELLAGDGRADMLTRAQVDRQLADRHAAAMTEIRWVLDGPRYQGLRMALYALATSPPLTGEAARAATDVVPGRVAKSVHRLDRAVRRAGAKGVPAEERAQLIHEVRKGAKRVRYAAELAETEVGAPAARTVQQMKRVQTELGHAQDRAVLLAQLEGLAPGVDNAFALGRVHARLEDARTADARSLTTLWAEVSGRRSRRWLR